jgi:hypothetical protein
MPSQNVLRSPCNERPTRQKSPLSKPHQNAHTSRSILGISDGKSLFKHRRNRMAAGGTAHEIKIASRGVCGCASRTKPRSVPDLPIRLFECGWELFRVHLRLQSRKPLQSPRNPRNHTVCFPNGSQAVYNKLQAYTLSSVNTQSELPMGFEPVPARMIESHFRPQTVERLLSQA